MFESLLAPWRAKFRLAISATVCYAVAGVAGAIAFAFALAALFSWLAQLFGGIIASLIIAGVFLVIAIIPILIYGAKQRAEEKRVAEAVAKARATQWISPATLSLGLQAARIVGRNRGLAAAGVGALVVGWLISQMMPAEGEPDDETVAEPAE
jgi:tetrahydromethanopterin S-methyltransferase subunit D